METCHTDTLEFDDEVICLGAFAEFDLRGGSDTSDRKNHTGDKFDDCDELFTSDSNTHATDYDGDEESLADQTDVCQSPHEYTSSSDVAAVVNTQYEILKTLTPGAEGEVFVCVKHGDEQRTPVVVKAGSKGGTETEARFLRNINHRAIINAIDAFRNGPLVCLVLPHYTHDLYTYVEERSSPLSLETAFTIQKRLLEALSYLHGRGIIHRDVKLENIFLNEPNDAVLGDLGAACKTTASPYTPQDYGWVGTLEINSPELLALDTYCAKTDIWSAGIVLFEMLVQRVSLFGIKNPSGYSSHQLRGIIKAMQVHPAEFPVNGNCRIVKEYGKYSEVKRKPYTVPPLIRKYTLHMDAEYLICKMLTFDQQRRPTADDLLSLSVITHKG
ncbi:US3 [anatid alphaherpesvirus 1]|uniref:Protein kinase n=2 Tax=anatid alphaherpesvirus 1 TaxID=104388 RepID=B4XS28_9ALPH|nr:US3 [Anatid alphaherpesvirus 1]YP_010795387.1 US3 [Anatid alphaherpesvirus 1]AHD45991.1 US3 [BAC cloning vector pDEV-vac]ABU49265.1 US3 [Anatid alphaherpesvirus 1]ABU68829.1 protein kinase [Anatid alphaherpesvirus 1]ADU04073.1 US3 [Anatid alphaherpesvirus 1]AEN80133.1 US3 [Anatid alphaherpesvirus 1]